MLFGRKKNKVLLAPLSGAAARLDKVPDPVFSGLILGDGAAVEPESELVLAPADCTVVNVADTLHAFGLETDDGLEILIHIGLDTVKLGGKGFTTLVRAGERVRAGQPLCRVDFGAVKAAGLEVWTPVVITNMDAVVILAVSEGRAEAGKSVLLTYSRT